MSVSAELHIRDSGVIGYCPSKAVILQASLVLSPTSTIVGVTKSHEYLVSSYFVG